MFMADRAWGLLLCRLNCAISKACFKIIKQGLRYIYETKMIQGYIYLVYKRQTILILYFLEESRIRYYAEVLKWVFGINRCNLDKVFASKTSSGARSKVYKKDKFISRQQMVKSWFKNIVNKRNKLRKYIVASNTLDNSDWNLGLFLDGERNW